MSSNNVNNFQGNTGTSSNNVDVFAEIINGGGGGMGIEYNLYAADMWAGGNPTLGGGFYYVADGGGNYLGVNSFGSESAGLEPVQVVKWQLYMATTPEMAGSPNSGLADYYNAFIAGGGSLPAEMAIPFANMFFQAMQDVIGGIPTGGV